MTTLFYNFLDCSHVVCLYQKSVCKFTVPVCKAVRLAFSCRTSAISFPFIPVPWEIHKNVKKEKLSINSFSLFTCKLVIRKIVNLFSIYFKKKNYVCFKLYVYVLPTVPYSVDRIHVFDRFADQFYPLQHIPPRIRP